MKILQEAIYEYQLNMHNMQYPPCFQNNEKFQELSELAKATITELANMIVAQAVTKLSDLGFKFELTPPTIFTGEKMEISDFEVEALIVPIETKYGKIEINVALRERSEGETNNEN